LIFGLCHGALGRHYLRHSAAYWAIVSPAPSEDLPIERPCGVFRRVAADSTLIIVILSVLHRAAAAAVMSIQFALRQGPQMGDAVFDCKIPGRGRLADPLSTNRM
jgi:hypothetical protein